MEFPVSTLEARNVMVRIICTERLANPSTKINSRATVINTHRSRIRLYSSGLIHNMRFQDVVQVHDESSFANSSGHV